MRVLASENLETMSRLAAGFVVAALRRRPDMVLCASAGNTPTGTYARLAALHRRQPRLFTRIRILQIDEWGGLRRGDPVSCEADLHSKLLGPLQIGRDRFAGFRTDAARPRRECERIAQWLTKNGPIDVCILGLGRNGHIAMNEPGPNLVPHAHVTELAPSSRMHSMLRRLPRKPRRGMTLGLGDILCSRKILLLVSGRAKRGVLRRLLRPSITPRLPASVLWLHPDVTILADKDAAAGLNR